MTSRIEEAFVRVSVTSLRPGPSSQTCRASWSGSPRIRRKTQAPNISLHATAFGSAGTQALVRTWQIC
jgi:hypothetical protein